MKQRTHSFDFFLFAHLQEKEFSTLQTETSLKAILSTESLKEKESTLSKGDTTKASGPEGGIMVKAVYRSQTDHRIVEVLRMELPMAKVKRYHQTVHPDAELGRMVAPRRTS